MSRSRLIDRIQTRVDRAVHATMRSTGVRKNVVLSGLAILYTTLNSVSAALQNGSLQTFNWIMLGFWVIMALVYATTSRPFQSNSVDSTSRTIFLIIGLLMISGELLITFYGPTSAGRLAVSTARFAAIQALAIASAVPFTLLGFVFVTPPMREQAGCRSTETV